eukprot:3827091-Pyramimonas_sp.AAC.1
MSLRMSTPGRLVVAIYINEGVYLRDVLRAYGRAVRNPLRGVHNKWGMAYRDLFMLSSKLGMGKVLAKASTSALRAATSALFSRPTTKSFSILPCDACTLMQICAARCRNSPTLTKSASKRPLEVMAGVPMRTPPGLSALASPRTAFLLRVMWQSSQTFSILFPEMLSGRISHRIRWLSVPPVTIL